MRVHPFLPLLLALAPSSSCRACPYVVEDGADASGLDFTHPLLFRGNGGGSMDGLDLGWLRREYGVTAVSVGHPGNYVLGNGHVQDKMLLGRYLDVLASASPSPLLYLWNLMFFLSEYIIRSALGSECWCW